MSQGSNHLRQDILNLPKVNKTVRSQTTIWFQIKLQFSGLYLYDTHENHKTMTTDKNTLFCGFWTHQADGLSISVHFPVHSSLKKIYHVTFKYNLPNCKIIWNQITVARYDIESYQIKTGVKLIWTRICPEQLESMQTNKETCWILKWSGGKCPIQYVRGSKWGTSKEKIDPSI